MVVTVNITPQVYKYTWHTHTTAHEIQSENLCSQDTVEDDVYRSNETCLKKYTALCV
jgi:hypothetical protein